jgi:MFS family permease
VTGTSTSPRSSHLDTLPGHLHAGWSVLSLALALAALGALFSVLNHFQPAGSIAGWFDLVIPLAVSVPGAVIVGYRPANPLGRILCTMGLTMGVAALLGQYSDYALRTNPGSVPGGVLAAWLQSFFWFPVIGLVPLLLLLVPDGSLPSPRWRPVAWVPAAAIALVILAGAFSPGPIGADPRPGAPQNPVGIEPARQVLEVAAAVGFLVIPAVTVIALLALVLRFRRAQGVERQQLKWFTYGAFLLVVGLAALLVPLSEAVAKAILAAGVGCFTAGVAVAVLRYGLYEIDVIVNRTLVYGLLTVLLGLGYAGAVLIGGQLAGQERSNLVVAGSTLAVAAAFQPARRRVQAGVDRRFNRRKYDSAKTIEGFSARLREQVDLDTLSAELLAVVDQTMQPATASLWLRPSPHGSSGKSRSKAQPTTWAY